MFARKRLIIPFFSLQFHVPVTENFYSTSYSKFFLFPLFLSVFFSTISGSYLLHTVQSNTNIPINTAGSLKVTLIFLSFFVDRTNFPLSTQPQSTAQKIHGTELLKYQSTTFLLKWEKSMHTLFMAQGIKGNTSHCILHQLMSPILTCKLSVL